MKTIQEKQKLAKDLNGVLGTGSLNWMGDVNMETKQPHFSIFFNKESSAKKAQSILGGKVMKTPKFINQYFKYSILMSE